MIIAIGHRRFVSGGSGEGGMFKNNRLVHPFGSWRSLWEILDPPLVVRIRFLFFQCHHNLGRIPNTNSIEIGHLDYKSMCIQENIPVGCVPPAFLVPVRGGGLSIPRMQTPFPGYRPRPRCRPPPPGCRLADRVTCDAYWEANPPGLWTHKHL